VEHELRDRYIDLLKQTLCASLYDESSWRRVEGPMAQDGLALSARVKRKIVSALRRRGLILVRTVPYDAEIRRQGLDWPLFGYTMTGRSRLDTLERLTNDILENDIPGDIVETGVWRGGSMMLVAALLKLRNATDRTIWLADSFEGMPKPTESDNTKSHKEDFSDRDYLSVSIDRVKSAFERFDLGGDNLRFLKGWFSDTLPSAPIGKIALLRLDGDLYESTRDALLPLYDKVAIGGYIIVDDYNSWIGCKRAVDEFREDRGIESPIIRIDAHAVYWQRTE